MNNLTTEFDPQNYTLLIVDDVPANLSVLAEYLEGFGFDVVTARTGESGLERARFIRPDLILLDVLLPGLNGFDTCRALKADAQTASIPVIFMTVLTETENKLRGFEVGAVDYITKPFQKEEVLARVTTQLQLRVLTERLEQRVNERTLKLESANQQLQQEIAERRHVEESLRKSEAQYRALIEQMPAVVYTNALDEKRTRLYVSPQIERLLGYSPAEWLAGSRDLFVDLLHPDDRDWVQAEMRRSLTLVVPVQIEYRVKNCHNRYIWVRDESIIVHNEAGQPLLVQGIVMDITEIKQAQEALEAGNRQLAETLSKLQQTQAQLVRQERLGAIGQLAGGIAHDFNNLLVPIIGYAQLGMSSLSADDALYPSLQRINEAAERAATLTRQILAFSSRQVLEMRLLNLNDVIDDFKKMLQRLIGEDIALTACLASSLWPVQADPAKIEQILLNLAVNARDAMPQGGKLIIETANVFLDEEYAQKHVGVIPGPYVLLAVSDTGVGMPPEVIAHIFEPFFTTKPQGEGTGLGLATVFGIVKQHNGVIWVYSEPNQGATFKIYLPQANIQPETWPAEVVTPSASFRGTETVLVVEDEEFVRELACRTLTLHGYSVLGAASPAEGIELATGYLPGVIHLLLTDVIMPEMNGQYLFAEINRLHPDIKVLYMSGYTDNVIVRHGILSEGANFLQKPFSVLALTQKVRDVLGHNPI